MKSLSRMRENASLLIVGKGFDVFSGLLSVSLIARYLGVEEFGIFASIRATCSVLATFADMGLETIMIREIAKDEEKAPLYFFSSAILMGVFSVISLCILFLAVNFTTYSIDVKNAIYITAVASVFSIFGDLFSSLFRSFERMGYEALKMILSRGVYIIVLILVIYFDKGFMSIFIAFLIANFIDMALGAWFTFKRFIRPVFQSNARIIKFILFETIPLGIGITLRKLTLRIDILVLTAMKSKMEVGLFGAVYRLIVPLRLVPNILKKVVLPAFSRLSVDLNASMINAYEKSFKFFFVLYVPFTVLLIILADKVVLLMFGKDYIASTIVLQILSVALLFMFLNVHLVMILTVINEQRPGMISSIICLATNFIFDILLIPKWSYIGASIATLIAEIVLFILCFYIISKKFHALYIHKIVWKPLLCGVVMAVLLFYAHQFNLFLLMPLGLVIYFPMLFLVRTFSVEETDLIKEEIFLPGLRRLKLIR